MNTEDKARRLVDFLSTVMEEAEGVDKTNPACCEVVSPQEMKVLRTIGREQCCVMSGLAGAIRCSLSSLTGLVDRLVAKRLVKRDRSTEDRRVVQVELTEEGQELHKAAQEARVAMAKDMLKALSPEEQDKLVALFGRMTESRRAGKK